MLTKNKNQTRKSNTNLKSLSTLPPSRLPASFMKNYFLLAALAATTAYAGKPPPQSTTSSSSCEQTIATTDTPPTIDGVVTGTEWDSATVIDLYLASKDTKDNVLAKGSVMADCGFWYVKVEMAGASEYLDLDTASEAFLKLDGQIPDLDSFERIHEHGVDIGWEAKYVAPANKDTYDLKLHTLAYDGSQVQTAGSPGSSISVCLNLSCENYVPPEPVVVVTPAPVTPATPAPVTPATPAPVTPATAAPVVPPTAAPVVPPTAAPVVPPTAAPVVPPTAAPVPECTVNGDCLPLNPLVCQTYVCNSGVCETENAPNDSPCGDNAGSECMLMDSCQNGVCFTNQFKPSGTTCGDQSTSDCNMPDTCDGAGTCQSNHVEDGNSCGAPEDQCSFADSCSKGECVAGGFKSTQTTCGPTPSGPCDAQDYCDGHGSCQELFKPSTHVCREVESDCDAPEMCTGTSTECPTNNFKPAGESCGSPEMTECNGADTCDGSGTCQPNLAEEGSSCGAPEDQCSFAHSCSSGECVFGGFKSTQTTCGPEPEGPCDAQDYCNGSGTCQDHFKPSTHVCREVASDCDAPEMCSGTSKECPEDTFKPVGESCGNSEMGECNGADTCDGSGTCQPNLAEEGSSCGAPEDQCSFAHSCSSGECVFGGFKSTQTTCGPEPEGPCDAQDYCDGGGACQELFKPTTEVCREAASDCDAPEMCTGTSKACPEDTFKPAGDSCGSPDMTECNGADTCDGSGTCQPNLVEDGSSCGAPEDQCSFAHSCSSGECVFGGFKSAQTTCGPDPVGPCDAQDYCNGSGACQDLLKPTTQVCREAASDCDAPEMCSGTSKDCPVDTFQPVGESCGSPTETECDKPDTCDGHGTCLYNLEPDGAGCGAPEDECSLRHSCSVGECVFEGYKPILTPCGSTMETECNMPDSCDGQGLCLPNFEPDGKACGAPEDECNLSSSCSTGECEFGGYKPSTTPCGTIDGVCDVQDHCNGAGQCEDKVESEGVVCRAAVDDCDVRETCNGVMKDCPADTFAAMDTPCGKTGAQLAYCEIQDICDGSGKCVDQGDEPVEMTFKCGNDNFLCGNEVTGALCQDGSDQVFKANQAECDILINAVTDETINPYGVKCPNGRAISHYTKYDCHGVEPIKCEAECSDSNFDAEGCPVEKLVEDCGKCQARRLLRGKLNFFSF